MLNRSANLVMSTSILKALPGKLDIKRHSPSILYIQSQVISRQANGPIVQKVNIMSIHKFHPINCLQGLSLPIQNTIVGTSLIMSTLARRSGA